ncbi:hypothetical protein S40293_09612 [Stachybotrys chartarum IBT 40293]|nr:hypothetical protein S40293_09612 [Stachybotrys chartarum IBT 40293]KFA75243.1 hypothetical protein S40288_00145 [Stachybotrys chartarum IBT 40288]
MLLLSPYFVALAAVILFTVLACQYWLSPLRKIPGPFYCKLTSLVLRWNELQANRTVFVHQMHLKYGPVVRIAPNEVSFTSWTALKEIYCSSGSGYDKTEFYDLFRAYGRRTMFTMLCKSDHAARKRILADRYANSNVMKESSISGIKERAEKFAQRCTEPYDGVNDIFNAGDEEMMHQVASDDSLQNRLISHWSPKIHQVLEGVLAKFAKPRQIPLATKYVLDSSQRSDVAPFTLMSRLHEKQGGLESIDMAAECLDHMAAGIDTTGDGLCFLMWELSQPRSLRFQRQLQEELQRHPNLAFDKLPFLDAVVCESLRCFPPIPMSLPRYVPQGGRSIDGFWLPHKTIVSCQAFSVHRVNEDIFPDPDVFNPERWLEPEGDADRRRMLFAFSNGGRGCVGKQLSFLALAEMKLLLREIYSKFGTTPEASMTDGLMTMSDQLISSRPSGGRCLLKFQRLASNDGTNIAV